MPLAARLYVWDCMSKVLHNRGLMSHTGQYHDPRCCVRLQRPTCKLRSALRLIGMRCLDLVQLSMLPFL